MKDSELITASDLMKISTGECRHELRNGELILKPFLGWSQGLVATKLGSLLSKHADPEGTGVVLASGTGFHIAEDPDTVLVPTVSFVSRKQLLKQEVGTLSDDYPKFAPDIAVEVVEPSDLPSDVENKAYEWLGAGSKLVWTVWLRSKSITVYGAASRQFDLETLDTLEASPVLDGFSVRVSDLFE